jgi:uncharacterized membrane protein YjfL (UPF0719 family)
MPDEVIRFFQALGTTVLWTAVSIVIVGIVFEVLEKRYKLLDEIFEENSVAAGVFGASIVLGVFYTVTQIVIH